MSLRGWPNQNPCSWEVIHCGHLCAFLVKVEIGSELRIKPVTGKSRVMYVRTVYGQGEVIPQAVRYMEGFGEAVVMMYRDRVGYREAESPRDVCRQPGINGLPGG